MLVAEGWNVKTGLGSRFGSYLLQAGFKGKYNHIGTHREGCGGLWQQMGYQGLDPRGIAEGDNDIVAYVCRHIPRPTDDLLWTSRIRLPRMVKALMAVA